MGAVRAVRSQPVFDQNYHIFGNKNQQTCGYILISYLDLSSREICTINIGLARMIT